MIRDSVIMRLLNVEFSGALVCSSSRESAAKKEAISASVGYAVCMRAFVAVAVAVALAVDVEPAVPTSSILLVPLKLDWRVKLPAPHAPPSLSMSLSSPVGGLRDVTEEDDGGSSAGEGPTRSGSGRPPLLLSTRA